MDIADVHCHPTDSYDDIGHLGARGVGVKCCMSTRLDDQSLVEATRQKYRNVIPFYGIHPWYAHQLRGDGMYTGEYEYNGAQMGVDEYLCQLERNLASGGHLGEVGIDKAFRLPLVEGGAGAGGSRKYSWCKVTMSHQRKVLLAQLLLAEKYDRSVSLHCVQAHGQLLGIFDTVPTPLRICLHSYSGPKEEILRWSRTKHRVFYSFSTAINSRKGFDGDDGVLARVPDDSLLVETDWHCAGEEMEERLRDMVDIVCRVKGWTLEETCSRLRQNFASFIPPPPLPS